MNYCSPNVSSAVLSVPAKRANLAELFEDYFELSLELNLTIASVLIVASALVGIATGYVFRIWALVVISPPIAVFSAMILRTYEFGMMAGVMVIAICLVVCQLAYFATAYFLHARDVSAHDEVDGQPGEASEQKIRREHK